jgi:AraC-like DNA-binding protein
MFAMQIADNESLINHSFFCNDEMQDILQQIFYYSAAPNQFQCEMLLTYFKSLISMLLYYDNLKDLSFSSLTTKQIYENETFNEIINYIQSNIYSNLNIQELCHRFGISRSSLQNLFHNNLQTTPKAYITEEKLEISKRLLRQRWKTVSEVADMLDYNSIHYFSRLFKKRYNINPSEYAKQNN